MGEVEILGLTSTMEKLIVIPTARGENQMSARDDYGFLIAPKNLTHWGYQIRSFEANGATEYDVYFGRRLMGTFPSVAAAKAYIEQPLKGE